MPSAIHLAEKWLRVIYGAAHVVVGWHVNVHFTILSAILAWQIDVV